MLGKSADNVEVVVGTSEPGGAINNEESCLYSPQRGLVEGLSGQGGGTHTSARTPHHGDNALQHEPVAVNSLKTGRGGAASRRAGDKVGGREDIIETPTVFREDVIDHQQLPRPSGGEVGEIEMREADKDNRPEWEEIWVFHRAESQKWRPSTLKIKYPSTALSLQDLRRICLSTHNQTPIYHR